MNFALILFVLLLFTGAFALADGVYFSKQRRRDDKEPWWIEYPKSFFPVILIVFLLRSFLVEPFKIPTGSMVPTLLVGDFILVSKFAYGIRLPLVNRKIVGIGEPKRGDVMVFRFPDDPSIDYIKRVVGVSGDKIVYENKRLSINGVPQPRKQVADYLNRERVHYSAQFQETLGGVEHAILQEGDAPAAIPFTRPFPFRENCNYNEEPSRHHPDRVVGDGLHRRFRRDRGTQDRARVHRVLQGQEGRGGDRPEQPRRHRGGRASLV